MLYDDDGIDGAWSAAMDRAMREDARLRRPVNDRPAVAARSVRQARDEQHWCGEMLLSCEPDAAAAAKGRAELRWLSAIVALLEWQS